jgi:hypothetical protein
MVPVKEPLGTSRIDDKSEKISFLNRLYSSLTFWARINFPRRLEERLSGGLCVPSYSSVSLQSAGMVN